MTYAEAVVAMQSFFNTQWASATPIVWGSDAPAKPTDGTWVRFNVNHADGSQASMGSPGSNRFDRSGQVIVQIFQKQGGHGIDARDKASSALDIYSGAVDGGVRYENARVNEVGDDGFGFHQVNVIADFRYQSIT